MFTLPTESTPTVENIELAIKYIQDRNTSRLNRLACYYYGEHAILNRTVVYSNINNRLIINHAKYITDMSIGFLMGDTLQYQLFKDGYRFEEVEEQYRQQSISDIDLEIAKQTSIYGVAYEQLYQDENGNPRSVVVDPRNCVVAYDDSVEHKPLFGVIYDPDNYLRVLTSEDTREYPNAELSQMPEIKPSNFATVPLLEYSNNKEQFGDFESVLSLIDAYNILQSERVNDVEQLVSAVMLIKNMDLTKEQMRGLRVNRVLSNIPADADVEYITKALDGQSVEQLRNVISEDIHKISMVPNLTDREFVGNSSGVAIRYKLVGFEQMTKNKERSIEKTLKKRYSVYSKYLAIKQKASDIPEYDIDVIFKRALPQNDLEAAKMINLLKDTLSDFTLIPQLSFTGDAESEIEWKKEQDKEQESLSSNSFGRVSRSDEDTEGLE